MKYNIPDVQEQELPQYQLPINIVGVENIKLPFLLCLRNNSYKDLVSKTSLSSNLVNNKKGISMSRLLLSIQPYLNVGLNWRTIKKCLDAISDSIGEDNSHLKFKFDLPILKKSPKSDYEFPLYYSCYFEGYKSKGIDSKINYEFYQSVIVQYASYCPCSAALSKALINDNLPQGFPHAQRSFTKIILSMNLHNKKQIWLEDIIDIVNTTIKTQPYPIIKRIDEQEIAKIASENPLFVEDAIRILSHNINKLDGVIDWIVKCTHEESIHTHEAIAINCAGITDGFTHRNI